MKGSEINLDFERYKRIGFDEAVFCQGKSVAQLDTILDLARERGAGFLLTRLEPAAHASIASRHLDDIDYDPVSRTGFFGGARPSTGRADVAIVTAGTSDIPVAREAARTLAYFGHGSAGYGDVGVAGLWRLMGCIDEIRRHPVVIVAAGMDGALPSVLCGLVPGLVIAVPTSVGYGAAEAGRTALHAALASCAPGLVVVNIDNGYGAASAAIRALGQIRARDS